MIEIASIKKNNYSFFFSLFPGHWNYFTTKESIKNPPLSLRIGTGLLANVMLPYFEVFVKPQAKNLRKPSTCRASQSLVRRADRKMPELPPRLDLLRGSWRTQTHWRNRFSLARGRLVRLSCKASEVSRIVLGYNLGYNWIFARWLFEWRGTNKCLTHQSRPI